MKQKIISAIILLSILMMGCGGEALGNIEMTEMSGELSEIVQKEEAEESFISLEESEQPVAESISSTESNAELVEYCHENLCH